MSITTFSLNANVKINIQDFTINDTIKMGSDNFFIEANIKKMITDVFQINEIVVVYEESHDCHFVIIFDEKLYYSDEYQKLVMDIKRSYLWERDIDNYFFACERKENFNELGVVVHQEDKSLVTSITWSMGGASNYNKISSDNILNTAA